ncbi:MAG TPA: single-stranded DNA-binding protein [Bacilli bacterium]|nr:single-stranded DNA-binding protein [Bacilli bacterium]
MVNRTVLVGRLARDPELRRTPNNVAVTSFTVAVDDRPSRDREKTTSFINVVCWNHTAEFVANYLKKGNLVGVDGRIQQRTYENNEGRKINVFEVIADSVQALESRAQREEDSGYVADKDPAEVTGIDIADDDLPF